METKLRDQHTVDREARQWLVLLSSGELSPEQRGRFDAWCEQAEQNLQTYARLSSLWHTDLPTLGRSAAAEALRRSVYTSAQSNSEKNRFVKLLFPLSLPRVAWSLAAAVVVAVFAVVWFQPTMVGIGSPDTRLASGVAATEIAEVRDQLLADGSTATIGARSRLRVAFTPAERYVSVESGQVFFSVVKDASRPFVVEAGGVRVQVVGTEFDVHLADQKVRVAVLEGRVRVVQREAVAVADTQEVAAGHEILSAPGGVLGTVQPIQSGEPGAWRHGRLVYKNALLGDVIADANRYYGGHIGFASNALKNLRISTAFQGGQVEQMLKTLPDALPIEVDWVYVDRVVIRPASK